MWLLPWEKLPELILRPLMVCVAIFVFYPAYEAGGPDQAKTLYWGIGFAVVGVVVTSLGAIQAYKSEKSK
jgi:hypothetical protein